MKAIVTGGAGFIGSHLVDTLVTAGAKVHVIDNLATGSGEYINPGATFHFLDIRSQEAKDLILRERPDAVFHQAAQVDVQRSIHDPGYDAQVNIIGTVNVLEACRQASVKKIIYASSCAVYGDLNTDRITEDDPTDPISYYGVSKLTPEAYIRIFHRLYGLPYTILRYANVYGPRQTPKGEGGVVAIFLDRIKKGLPLRIHGDGEQTRDFVYVKDVVAANLAAFQHGKQDVIQVGTSTRTSINQVVRLLSKLHGTDLPVVYEQERPGDIKHSCLDNRKAYEKLGWQPKYDIVHGLEESYHLLMQEA
ncbi:NAD-dependent epimerase/dehydratase family protein [Effusibacillus consociatus]|uniref:NAD-dependent epimerase/dehydratase family protein n=1 Tax=Effusibacillus consociatus TaxID=1117041 RepID=A0ABV9PUN2_9BACL